MNVLAIGNSFSQDATRYLYQVARKAGVNLNVVNLYIGGCPLSKHYTNMLTDSKSYALEFNGMKTGFFVSIKDALVSREWDYITFQQVSSQSINYDTYQPYLDELSAYVRKFAPKAKFVVHQTWAYEQDSHRLCEMLGYTEQADMFNDLKVAYDEAAKAICADFIIPSGYMFQKMISEGLTVHRDTLHVKYGLGRYALSLLWYTMLTGNEIEDIDFDDFDEEVSAEEIVIIKKCVAEAAKEYKKA